MGVLGLTLRNQQKEWRCFVPISNASGWIAYSIIGLANLVHPSLCDGSARRVSTNFDLGFTAANGVRTIEVLQNFVTLRSISDMVARTEHTSSVSRA